MKRNLHGLTISGLSALACLIVTAVTPSQPAQATAYANYVHGTVTDITSSSVGLYMKVNTNEVPTNCTGTPYDWIVITADKQTMISVALSMYLANHRDANIYTSGIGTSGYCEVNQYDPLD